MIGLRKIYPYDTETWARVERLYADAFPRNERRAESEMRRLAECGRLNVGAVMISKQVDNGSPLAIRGVTNSATQIEVVSTAETVAVKISLSAKHAEPTAFALEISQQQALAEKECFAGFITWWDFGEFVYGEHFAMLPECRGAGIGGEVIDRFVAEAGRPVILEVELPTDEMSRRRIGFYERHGFAVCDAEYVQPPYDAGGGGVPMRLMSHGVTLDAAMFARVRDTLYAEVYGV